MKCALESSQTCLTWARIYVVAMNALKNTVAALILQMASRNNSDFVQWGCMRLLADTPQLEEAQRSKSMEAETMNCYRHGQQQKMF